MPASPEPTIADLLRAGGGPTFSFEFFPPRNDAGAAQLNEAIEQLEPLAPDFVSVTYGANGSARDRTLEATRDIVQRTSLRVMGHLTCTGQTVAELEQVIDAYAEIGVRHILAIRGDMPGGPTVPWQPHPGGLANATELVQLIASRGDFCIGVAAFPDPHPQANDVDLDARLLAEKAEAGAEFAITQLFFRLERYVELVNRVRDLNCELPIVPGIMPVTNIAQISTFAALSGAELPVEVTSRLLAVADEPDAVRSVGSQIAAELSLQLLQAGAPGLHYYTQNRSAATREIYQMLINQGVRR